MPLAIDISNWTGEITDEWCQALAPADVGLVIVRLSTETGRDQQGIAARQVECLARNNIPWQGYLWAYWDQPPSVLWQQAQASLPDGWPGYYGRTMWIDCEDVPSGSALTLPWLERYGDLLLGDDFQPGVYTNRSWWTRYVTAGPRAQRRVLRDWPLWVAFWDWARTCDMGGPLGPWRAPSIKQTGETWLEGIPGIYDVNVRCG